MPQLLCRWPVDLGEVALVDAHERTAVVERGLVEDRDPLASLLVVNVRPHVVVGADLLPASGQLHLREERVAVDHVAELEAELDELLLDGAIAVALDFGRQDIALDELALASRFHLEDGIGRIAGTAERIQSGSLMQERMIGCGVAGTGHVRNLR